MQQKGGKEGGRRGAGRRSREREQCVQRCTSREDTAPVEEKSLRITNIAPGDRWERGVHFLPLEREPKASYIWEFGFHSMSVSEWS